MRIDQEFNRSWTFLEGFEPHYIHSLQDADSIDLPHNAVELPLNYFDDSLYQRPFTYQKEFEWEEAFEGKDILLCFNGVMADSVVYLNGFEVQSHRDGYTPFEARLTEHLVPGRNLITVKIDGSENPEIPPFGGQIDYLTYAGIYRDVRLQIRTQFSISNAKIETPDPLGDSKSVLVDCYFSNQSNDDFTGTIEARIIEPAGGTIASIECEVSGKSAQLKFSGLQDISLWDLDTPVLYQLSLKLKTDSGIDSYSATFGFREINFTPEGFKLNGQTVKLVGLNRHQSFPYAGYAMGRYPQERDAEILKYELACNVVRTSHYPQSPWFLDHCDRIGLLVLEEIPGWQHIGDENWQDEAVENVRRMIERDWNHPSIITWGVRINESPDHHDFYSRTNALARELDSTRQTHGVRAHAESEFLEDIYTINDFTQGEEELSHNGCPQVPLKSQQLQTGLPQDVPYLVTEYNGHMFPTKAGDPELRQNEHVLRHLNVLNRTYGDPAISGCIGWCMFDYNTHKDFGSGDRICHHGVLSIFREPKFAAYVYASQGDPEVNPVMKPVTYWARGERNIGGVLPLIVLTNLDEIELRFPNGDAARFSPAVERYPHLPHAPVIVERDDINSAVFGSWGNEWNDVEIAGYLRGEEIQTIRMVSSPVPAKLQLYSDKLEIDAKNNEEVRVIVRALDQVGSKLPFLTDNIDVEISGPAKLLGPDSSALAGGSTGFWIRSTGQTGDINIVVKSTRFPAETLSIAAI